MPKAQVHENLWKGANRRFKRVPRSKLAGHALRKPLTESAWARKNAREEKKRGARAQRLRALDLGYEFEAPKLRDAVAAAEVDDGEEEKQKKELEGKAEAEGEDAPKKALEAPPEAAVEVPAEESKEEEAPKRASKKTKKAAKAKKAKA